MKGLPRLRETVVMTRIYRLLSLSLLPMIAGVCLLGCGPITASQAITDARQTVDRAIIAADRARSAERARLAKEAEAAEDKTDNQDNQSRNCRTD